MTWLHVSLQGGEPDSSKLLERRGALDVQRSPATNPPYEHELSFTTTTHHTPCTSPQTHRHLTTGSVMGLDSWVTWSGGQEVNEVGGLVDDVVQGHVDGGPRDEGAVACHHVQQSTFDR